MDVRKRRAGRSSDTSGCIYLVVWFTIFFGLLVFGDPVLPWAVDALGGTPVPVAVVLSWLPISAVVLASTVNAVLGERRTPRKPLVAVVAAGGLALAVQVPVLLRRARSASDAHRAAADSPVGEALIAGALWPLGLVLVWTLVFLAVRWVAAWIGGRKATFQDDTVSTFPRERRRLLVGAGAAVVVALPIALATTG